jgi:hypothetical protein
MSERSLLKPNTWSPRARAVATGAMLIGLAAPGIVGCGGPKDAKLVGQPTIECGGDLKLPNITMPGSHRAAEQAVQKVERRLCQTVSEVGKSAVSLYKNRSQHKNGFDISSDSTGKGANKYEVTITEKLKNDVTSLEVTLNATKGKNEGELIPKELTGVTVHDGNINSASITKNAQGRWDMAAERDVHTSEEEWPAFQDYGLVDRPATISEYEDGSKRVQGVIFDTAAPYMNAA